MHVLVIVVTSLFAVAGSWQLSRLADRRASNQRLEVALAQDPVELDEMLAVGGEWPRRARASGRYDAERELLVPGRSFKGTGGSHVLTPLILPSGVAVLVDRGWVPADINEVPVARAAPPAGRVRVRGVVFPAEPKRPLGPDNPPTGELKTLRRIDPVRVRDQLPYDVMAMYLLLEEQRPGQDELPRYAPLPERTEGSHLTYAVQWFAFIAIALVVYAAILRREARKRAAQYPTTGGGEPSPSKTPAS